MFPRHLNPEIFALTSFLLIVATKNAYCKPKGGRGGGRGGIASYGGGGFGRISYSSARWAALSPATKVMVFVFGAFLGLFFLVGLYRAYSWCTKDTGRR
ncbi:uncharacterized protein LOC129229269 [Uloborus diversus]|uniref:uncharacterized protein LOC129229269 n=1 Tax=Uloborus diversus TaxID=327109 RepID=UPI0024091B39|nr:uncharacterized protein LOC129229269 [Uloborus diversus]